MPSRLGENLLSQQAQGINQANVESINKVREAHIAAVNNGDADAWVATFTDDGVQMPPNAPVSTAGENRHTERAKLT